MSKVITYTGTGTVMVEGFGQVSTGETIEVSDAVAKALCAENPQDWQPVAPAGKKKPDKGGGE
jgi:hypothetical protein